MFNGSGHIGHNKFIVDVDDAGTPKSVLTGSTNWTLSGIMRARSNNCIRIDDDKIAAGFRPYWRRLYEATLAESPEAAEREGISTPIKAMNLEDRRIGSAVTGKLRRAVRSSSWPAKHARQGAAARQVREESRRRPRPTWIACSR